MNCPNCFKELQEGTLFCDACGTPVGSFASDPSQAPVPASETGVEAMTFCANCGAQTKADVPFCQNCGAAIEMTKKKNCGKFPKKLIGIGIAVVAVILVAAIVLPLVLGVLGSSELECMAYVKDGQLYYVKNAKSDPIEITSEMVDDKEFDDSEIASVASSLYYYVTITPDGKRLLYVDKIEDEDEGITLYYKNPNNEKDEGTKIDSDITDYRVNVKGTKMIYLKGNKLYEYDMKEKKKIASDVEDFTANEACNVVFYQTDEGIYRWESGKDEDEIRDDENVEIYYITEDFKTVYYYVTDNESEEYYSYGDVYKWTVGGKEEKIAKDVKSLRVSETETLYYVTEDGDFCKVKAGETKAEEIDSDVSGIAHICENGDIYYTKSEEGSVKIGQFIEDDMKEEDESIVEMEEPVYPSYYDWDWPVYEDCPEYDDYDDFDAYYEAYEAWYDDYQAAYEAAEEAYDAAVDKYYEQMEIWEQYEANIKGKQKRDELRTEMEEYEMSVTNRTYCYYDGKNTKELVTNVGALKDYAVDASVLMVGINDFSTVEKIKLSEIFELYYGELYYAEDAIESAIENAQTYKLIFGDKVVDFDHDEVSGFDITDDGKTMYYKEDISEDDGTYTLIKLSIADSKIGKAEKVDADVYRYYVLNGDVHYFTDVEFEEDSYYGVGDYYINGKEIASDVCVSLNYNEDETVTYFFTDYDNEEYRGTLNVYKNRKAVEVCEDVDDYSLADNGDIYMLCDVSYKDYQGDIYVYAGKEAVKLDKDVYGVVYLMTTEQRIERMKEYEY